MRMISKCLLFSIAIGMPMLAAQIARADSYVNFTTYTAGFSPSTYEVGNQVYFSGGSASVSVTNFSLQFFGTFTTGDSIDIRFYGITGGPQNGYSYTPGPPIFDSTPIDLSSVGQTTGTLLTLQADGTAGDLPVGGVTVPKNFVFTVQFAGPDAGNNTGVALYGPSPTDGGNFGDAWVLNDPGFGSGWILATNGNSSLPYSIGAIINATPEPSSIALIALGGLAMVMVTRFGAKRRAPVQ